MSLEKKDVPHAYVFIGENGVALQEKTEAWKTVFEKKYGGSGIIVYECGETHDCSRLTNAFQAMPLFQTHAFIIVKRCWSSKDAEAQAVIAKHIESLPDTLTLVCLDDAMDSRTSCAKTILALAKKGVVRIEEFPVPTGAQIRTWILSRIAVCGGVFDHDAEQMFCSAYQLPVDGGMTEQRKIDCWSLEQEIKKLIAYARGRSVTRADIQCIASLPAFAHVFQLTDALLEKKRRDALHIVHLLSGDETTKARSQLLVIAAYLMSQFRSFLMLKDLQERNVDEQSCASLLGWNSKRVWVVSKKIRNYATADIQHIVARIAAFERMLKTGSGDALLNLDLAIVALTT